MKVVGLVWWLACGTVLGCGLGLLVRGVVLPQRPDVSRGERQRKSRDRVLGDELRPPVHVHMKVGLDDAPRLLPRSLFRYVAAE